MCEYKEVLDQLLPVGGFLFPSSFLFPPLGGWKSEWAFGLAVFMSVWKIQIF